MAIVKLKKLTLCGLRSEKTAVLTRLQALGGAHLISLNKLIDGPNIFLANEFFDALPIKQFIKKNNKWFEKNIKKNTQKRNPSMYLMN